MIVDLAKFELRIVIDRMNSQYPLLILVSSSSSPLPKTATLFEYARLLGMDRLPSGDIPWRIWKVKDMDDYLEQSPEMAAWILSE